MANFSFLNCKICSGIMPKMSDIAESHSEDYQFKPAELSHFKHLGGELYHCPDSGIFFYFFCEYDKGEPMVPSSHTYSLIRLNPIEVLNHYAAYVPGKEISENESGICKKGISDAFEFSGDWKGKIPWTLKKYVIETITDDCLERNDAGAFIRILLSHPDSVVRVEAAADLLLIATEEYAVWTIRTFNSKQKIQALKFMDVPEIPSKLIEVFVNGFPDETKVCSLDSFSGWRETSIGSKAYWGLLNAGYRNLDVSPAFPLLLNYLTSENKQATWLAAQCISDFGKKSRQWKKELKNGIPAAGKLNLSPEERKILSGIL